MHKTKKCKFCRSDVDSKAKVCPVCGRAQKTHGCLIALTVVGSILAGIIVMVILISSLLSPVDTGSASTTPNTTSAPNDEYITMEEFNRIEMGMTYEQVKEIVGSAGELSGETEMPGNKVVIVTWYGNRLTGSNANVTFLNNAVTGKAQVGLR